MGSVAAVFFSSPCPCVVQTLALHTSPPTPPTPATSPLGGCSLLLAHFQGQVVSAPGS